MRPLQDLFFYQSVRILIGILDNPNITVNQLNKKMNIEFERASKSATIFERLSLIIKKKDGKSKHLTLTKKGEELALLFRDTWQLMKRIERGVEKQ